ncbi:rhodanese-like domain-containing protein [Phycisphaerales bacterium AB-hyl4]|uniref:Rhodanese-like domain-containing protein n=1 Tax=Natronomicrosphaera hydrolytica TaxID=3242702 RepID=A0ABV4U9I0_9BACT
MLFRQFFDPKLAQYAYLVGCQRTGEALIIDPERDIDQYIVAAEAEGLHITAVAETHIHADFLSGTRELAERLGVRVYLSDEGGEAWASDWARNGSYDARFLKDGDTFEVGGIEVRAIHTPGHTPEHLSYAITDRGSGASSPMGVATGDFVFVGDVGRPDLLEQAAGMAGVQEPAARQLFASLQRFKELDDHVQVWPAHGAGSTCGKNLGAVPQTTVGYEKRYNAAWDAATRGEDAFVHAMLAGQPEPQTYFARMKRDNNHGVPLLDGLPNPSALTAAGLRERVDEGQALVIDTRLDRSAFMAEHIAGSLYAPINRSFSMTVGSLIEDESTPILLIIETDRVKEAVRDLVRIGYDTIVGFATAETLARYFGQGGSRHAIECITFAEVAKMQGRDDVAVVDVRFRSEFDAGHVPCAVHASYTRLPSYARERIPRDKTLLVHCVSGGRSAAAVAYLAREGFEVKLVDDVLSAYAKEGELQVEGASRAA